MNSSRNSFEMMCFSRFIILQSVVTRYLFVQKVVNCCSSSNRYEIDFMIQKGKEVLPLEVKAEQNLRSKSLKAYVEKYHPAKAIRFSMSDYQEQEWVTNIPLFAIRWIA